MDHRLLTLSAITQDMTATTSITNQFVDDDGIATYYVVQGDGRTTVEGPPNRAASIVNDGRDRANVLDENPNSQANQRTAESFKESFEGPLGSILRFYPRTSAHVRQSTALFNEFGTTVSVSDSSTDLRIGTDAGNNTIKTYKYIDTLINIVGVTTGYSIDVPIRIVKKTGATKDS